MSAVRFVRRELLRVAGVEEGAWTTVPVQGSGTFAVEAVLQTAVPKTNNQKKVRGERIGN